MNTMDANSLVQINPDLVEVGGRSSPGVYEFDRIYIEATYDRYQQSITAFGPVGWIIETKDPAGNVMGSGVVGADGSVTYTIEEGVVADETVIETSGKRTNVVPHVLLTSSKFLYEVDTADYSARVEAFQYDAPSEGEIIIDWGDGTSQEIYSVTKKDKSFIGYPHTYAVPGNYVLKVRAIGERYVIKVSGHHKLLDWGHNENYTIQNSGNAFYEVVPNDISPFITSCRDLFASCAIFNQSIDHWNMSNVTDTRGMFKNCSRYNQPLNSWDTSNFDQLGDMFYGAVIFDQPLDNWNLEKATDLGGMFTRCGVFNQPLNSWNVSNIKVFRNIFSNASKFNQPLDNWNLEKATDLGGMFTQCHVFNQDISGWKMPLATNMNFMFQSARVFNQDLSGWKTPLVSAMISMFKDAISFNQDLSGWCVPLISAEQEGFNDGGILTPEQKPVWGTCPNP